MPFGHGSAKGLQLWINISAKEYDGAKIPRNRKQGNKNNKIQRRQYQHQSHGWKMQQKSVYSALKDSNVISRHHPETICYITIIKKPVMEVDSWKIYDFKYNKFQHCCQNKIKGNVFLRSKIQYFMAILLQLRC